VKHGFSSRKGDVDATRGPVRSALIALAIPIMVSNLLQTAYNLVDAIWLGRVGKAAFTAPTVSWPIIHVLISLGTGFAVAGLALSAQYRGAGDRENACRAAGQTIVFMFIFAVLIGGLGAYFAGDILSAMGVERGEPLEQSTAYMRVMFAGIPAMFLSFATSMVLRGWGDAVTPMRLTLYSVVLNAVMDPILIFGLFGVPRMEAMGAAVATVISRSIVGLIGLYLLTSGALTLRLRREHFRPTRGIMRRIVRIGLPSSLGDTGTAFGFMVMIFFVVYYGTTVVAAWGAAQRVISILLMPAMGIGAATSTVVGQNLGAGLKERARKGVREALKLTAALNLVGSTIIFLFAPYVIWIFISDPDVIAYGAIIFRYLAFPLVFVGLLNVVLGAFRGAGYTVAVMALTLTRLWVFRIPMVYIISFLLGIGADGIWIGMALSNVMIGITALAWLARGRWERSVIREEPAGGGAGGRAS